MLAQHVPNLGDYIGEALYQREIEHELDRMLEEFEIRMFGQKIEEGMSLAFFASAGLAFPSFLRGLGWLYERIHNFLSKRKITGTTIGKVGEKMYRWTQKVIRLLMKPISKLFGLNEEHSNNLATAVMLGMMVALAGTGVVSIFGGLEGYDAVKGSIKAVAQIVKNGEIGLAVLALVLYFKHKDTFKDISAAKHAAEGCIDEHGLDKPKLLMRCATEHAGHGEKKEGDEDDLPE